jgi:hypothetical protein
LNVSVRTRIWGILHRWRSNLSDKIANKEKFRWHGFLLQILSNPKLIPYKNTHTTDCFEITNYLSLGLGSYLNSGILRCLPKKIALPASIVLWASKTRQTQHLKSFPKNTSHQTAHETKLKPTTQTVKTTAVHRVSSLSG